MFDDLPVETEGSMIEEVTEPTKQADNRESRTRTQTKKHGYFNQPYDKYISDRGGPDPESDMVHFRDRSDEMRVSEGERGLQNMIGCYSARPVIPVSQSMHHLGNLKRSGEYKNPFLQKLTNGQP